MSFNGKRTLIQVISGIILAAAYIVYALSAKAPAADNLKAWAIAMLVFIGISVAAIIVIEIIFHIVTAIGIGINEHLQGRDEKNAERIMKASMVEDERDKLIDLKSTHVGYICAGFGVVAALIALASGAPAVAALHVIFGAFAAASVAEGVIKIIYYEKGV